MNSFAEMAQNTMEKANTQAESLEQIGQGIEQLSGVVQGTAASSEENTAISINLAEGADKMNERVKDSSYSKKYSWLHEGISF